MKRKPTTAKKPKSRAGFTLVELLVVIVIIAVLASIGFPLAKKMQSRVADSKCVAQLRTWSTVIALYSSEHGGAVDCRDWNSIGYPGGSVYIPYMTSDGSDDSRVSPLATLRCCPALKGAAAKSGNGNSLTAYAMTDPSGVVSLNQPASYNLSKIKNPSRFVIMIEVTNVKTPAILRTAADFTSMVKPLTVAAQPRHKEGVVNALLGDFSVRTFTGKDVDRNIPSWTTF